MLRGRRRSRGGGAVSGPTSSMNLILAQPAGSTFTRSTVATDVVNGVLTDYAINAIRNANGYLPEGSRTNFIRNGEAQGAVAGTPGTLPTNWTDTNAIGLTRTVVGSGVINGFNYLDIRLSGTPSVGTYELFPEALTGVGSRAASSGQIYTSSFYIGMIAGSLTGITSVNARVSGRAAGVETEGTSQSITPTIDPTRVFAIRTLNNALTTEVMTELTVVVTAVAIDVTFRIAAIQLELGYGVSSYIRTTTATVTRGADLLSMPTSALGGFSATQGTLVVNGVAPRWFASGITSQTPACFATGGDYIQMTRFAFGSGRLVNRHVDGFAEQGSVAANPALTANTEFTCAQAWALNDLAIAIDGNAVSTSGTMPSLPTVTTFFIGQTDAGFGEHFFGYIRNIDYYNTRKPNADLVTLSA